MNPIAAGALLGWGYFVGYIIGLWVGRNNERARSDQYHRPRKGRTFRP